MRSCISIPALTKLLSYPVDKFSQRAMINVPMQLSVVYVETRNSKPIWRIASKRVVQQILTNIMHTTMRSQSAHKSELRYLPLMILDRPAEVSDYTLVQESL